MKKTFKSSRFCNISNFHYGFVSNPLKVQRSLFERITHFLFKIYHVAAWLTNVIHKYPISREVKQKIITWETFFFKNHTHNVVQKLVPDPFLKNETWAYLWINWRKFQTVYFDCMPSWGLSKYIETRLHTTCIYLIWSFFKKQRGLGLISLPYFLHNFWRKIFLLICSINWPSFIV